MNKFVLLAGVAALCLTSVTAEAKHRRKYYDPWQDEIVYYEQDYDDDGGYYIDDDEEVIILNRRDRRMRDAERRVEEELWWLEDRARKKLETRKKPRKVVDKPVAKKAVKPKVVATAKPKAVELPDDDIQTASLSKPVVVAKPKVVTKPKQDLPVASGKTIGCSAGAAVITGYGFGDVKPKICTGKTYAYSASRSGKAYEIKLTAASGEITDVKKVN
jgi:hypothetical protein